MSFFGHRAIITSQISVKDWYDVIGEKTAADAVLDRICSSVSTSRTLWIVVKETENRTGYQMRLNKRRLFLKSKVIGTVFY